MKVSAGSELHPVTRWIIGLEPYFHPATTHRGVYPPCLGRLLDNALFARVVYHLIDPLYSRGVEGSQRFLGKICATDSVSLSLPVVKVNVIQDTIKFELQLGCNLPLYGLSHL